MCGVKEYWFVKADIFFLSSFMIFHVSFYWLGALVSCSFTKYLFVCFIYKSKYVFIFSNSICFRSDLSFKTRFLFLFLVWFLRRLSCYVCVNGFFFKLVFLFSFEQFFLYGL